MNKLQKSQICKTTIHYHYTSIIIYNKFKSLLASLLKFLIKIIINFYFYLHILQLNKLKLIIAYFRIIQPKIDNFNCKI